MRWKALNEPVCTAFTSVPTLAAKFVDKPSTALLVVDRLICTLVSVKLNACPDVASGRKAICEIRIELLGKSTAPNTCW